MLYDNLLKQIHDQAQESQSTIQLTMFHGQAARLADLLEGKGTDRQWFVDRLNSLTAELKQSQDRNIELRMMMAGDKWYWEADGDNHLESLTCPIVIDPIDLRKLLAEKQQADDDIVMLGEDFDDEASNLLASLEKFTAKLRKRIENPWGRVFGRK